MEYIMKAMSTHISEAGVQEMACGALATLSINGKTNHQGGTSYIYMRSEYCNPQMSTEQWFVTKEQ